MPPIKPTPRRKLIRNLRKVGFNGPMTGSRHQRMIRPGDGHTVVLPNPHQGDINVNLLRSILKQAGITRKQWENL